MPHIDPERLALFALGEPVATADESEHLGACGPCVDELAALRHAAVAGRASFDVGELESPPEIVWTRIAKELSLDTRGSSPAAVAVAAAADARPAAAVVEQPASVVEPATVVAPAAVSEEHDTRGPRRLARAAASEARLARRPRRVARRIFALAASIVLVAGVSLGVWAATQRASLTEIAEASLAPFPDHATAEGTAIVEEQEDGSLAVRVALTADAAPDTFREVWLITGDASSLVSLGVLEGAEQTFAIPADVDLRDYSLVDVSQEPEDGDSAHSGDSIVRGELSFL